MEQPNFNYIDQLADGCNDFKNEVIIVLKKELPEEIDFYQKHIENGNLIYAAEAVHKLKHKVSLLSLEKSYYIAQEFENNLKENKLTLQKEFEMVLHIMLKFVGGL